MAARRCNLCSISYPVIPQFKVCPIHEIPTELKEHGEVTPDWQDQFQQATAVAKAAEVAGDRAFPLVPGVVVLEENGQLFVDNAEMHRAKVRLSTMPKSEQFYLFELEDGFIYETQGYDNSHRRWWVERVTTAVVIADEVPGEEPVMPAA